LFTDVKVRTLDKERNSSLSGDPKRGAVLISSPKGAEGKRASRGGENATSNKIFFNINAKASESFKALESPPNIVPDAGRNGKKRDSNGKKSTCAGCKGRKVGRDVTV